MKYNKPFGGWVILGAIVEMKKDEVFLDWITPVELSSKTRDSHNRNSRKRSIKITSTERRCCCYIYNKFIFSFKLFYSHRIFNAHHISLESEQTFVCGCYLYPLQIYCHNCRRPCSVDFLIDLVLNLVQNIRLHIENRQVRSQ